MTSSPPDIVRIAYVNLTVTDLGRARAFWVDLLGLNVEAETADTLYLRANDEFVHHSVALRRGPAAACSALGFRVRTPGCLDLAESWFAARGCATRRVPAGTAPGLGEAVRAQDPLGFTVEFVHHMERVEPLHQRYELHTGGRFTRIDHVNIVVPDVVAAHDHYRSLGFGLAETIEDDGTLFAAWMFRKPTVHDVALTLGHGPMLHHTAFSAHERADILHLCDVLGGLRLQDHIERGPGRHGVSNAFYLYLRDPDGHRIEVYTTDYYTGDPDHEPIRWSVHDPRRRDFWANPVVPTWYEGSAALEDLAGAPVPTRDQAPTSTEVRVGADGHGTTTAGR
jgi:3,4-dihydroxyphenylacetate 2,3-dioxygenase